MCRMARWLRHAPILARGLGVAIGLDYTEAHNSANVCAAYFVPFGIFVGYGVKSQIRCQKLAMARVGHSN